MRFGCATAWGREVARCGASFWPIVQCQALELRSSRCLLWLLLPTTTTTTNNSDNNTPCCPSPAAHLHHSIRVSCRYTLPKLPPTQTAMMMSTGMLGEGTFAATCSKCEAHSCADGIHVDMNHLKKGEVK